MTDELTKLASRLLKIIQNDRPKLERLDRYHKGDHDEPYMPEGASAEYALLAERSISNRMPLLIDTPTQALYVENYRPGTEGDEDEDSELSLGEIDPAWDHFERSHLTARQGAIYRGAFIFGHCFILAERDTKRPGKSRGRPLSALTTAAVYEDAANDLDPLAALTILRNPEASKSERGKGAPGLARMWDDVNEYRVTWHNVDEPTVELTGPHGSTEGCPVTRFAPYVDLEGRTIGLIEPMIPTQDRLNQTIFDLLIAQTGSSFTTRTITGMAPPVMHDADGEIVYDGNGNPVPAPFNINGKTVLMAEDDDVKFGTLEGTPLEGYIAAIQQTLQDWASMTQTPPHHMLGKIANLSADALNAAEMALARKVEEFRHIFAECWERHFKIVASMEGRESLDEHGEVVWRDMEARSLSQTADALGKLADQLGIPKRGLWPRVPGVKAQELRDWERMRSEDDADVAIAESLSRASGSRVAALNARAPAAEDAA